MTRMEIDYQALRQIGFSQLAIDCYGSLYGNGAATVRELGQRLQRPVWSIYECLRTPIKYGFIIKTPATYGPKLLFAISLDEALASYHKYLTAQLAEAIDRQHEQQRRIRRSA